LGGRGRRISEFEVSLVYKVSSRTARATQRKPCLEKPQKKKKKNFRRFKRWRKTVFKLKKRVECMVDSHLILPGSEIPTLGKVRQKDVEFKDNLGYIVKRF
jgi:hypothetical protein